MPCILTRCRAFVLPGCNTAQYKRLQRVLLRQCNYTAHATKQRTGLYSGFSCDCTHSTAHDTRPTKADIIPSAPRWRAYTRPDALNIYQTPPPRRTLHRPAQPPIIIRYIRRQTMPAAAGQRLPCADHWQALTHCQQYRPGAPAEGSASPPAQGQPGGAVQRRAAEPPAAQPLSFSGCRPIANRGQQ